MNRSKENYYRRWRRSNYNRILLYVCNFLCFLCSVNSMTRNVKFKNWSTIGEEYSLTFWGMFFIWEEVSINRWSSCGSVVHRILTSNPLFKNRNNFHDSILWREKKIFEIVCQISDFQKNLKISEMVHKIDYWLIRIQVLDYKDKCMWLISRGTLDPPNTFITSEKRFDIINFMTRK